MNLHRTSSALLLACSIMCLGCAKSSPPPTSVKSKSSSTAQPGVKSPGAGTDASKSGTNYWEDYPDVPKIEIMTEIDGIKVPRVAAKKLSEDVSGPTPVDLGNEHARKNPSTPVTGDTLTVRFNGEPKVLNPITENSAVLRYIMDYVNDKLFAQNLETFAWEPRIAKQAIFEDSVKLSADYPGRQRRISMSGAEAKPTLTLDYVLPPPKNGKPSKGPKISIATSDQDGKPVGHTWVGVFPVGRIFGAPNTGYHNWSDDKGRLEIGGFPTGQYTIRTGDEIFGEAKSQDDGTMVVRAATAENPLRDPLTLKAGEWQDIQRKTLGTFYLREDVKWSDGAPFTTKDLEFVVALMHNEFVDGDSVKTYYADLVEATPLGSHVIRMRYRQQYFQAADYFYELGWRTPPFHFFESIFKSQGRELTLKPLMPEEEAANKQISVFGQEFGKSFNTDERYNDRPPGTGRYIVEKWDRKDRVVLVRNPNYWEPSKAGYVDRIIVKFIPDQVTAFTALKAGEIDFLYDMSPEQIYEDWQTLDKKTQDEYVQSTWFIPMYQWIGWNQLATPLKDRRVRLALNMLFDRQDFIDKKMHGQATVVTGSQYVFGLGYDHDVLPIAYDPETARELLTEAGWVDTDNDGILDKNGEKLRIELRMGKGRTVYEQICEVMQKNFKSAGVDLQFQAMEWASFIEKFRSKEADAVMLRWVMDPESDPFQLWHGSEAPRERRGSNVISFNSTQADELIEMLRVTLDPEKRRKIHYSFHRLLDYEQPYNFLWTPKDFGAYHKRFRNVKWYRLRPGFDLAEWYVPKDEQLHN